MQSIASVLRQGRRRLSSKFAEAGSNWGRGRGAGAPTRVGRGRSRRAASQLPGSLQRGRTRGELGARKGPQRGRPGTTQVNPARGLPLHRVPSSHDPTRHPLPLVPPPGLRCTFPKARGRPRCTLNPFSAPHFLQEKKGGREREACRCGAERVAGGQGEGAGTYSAKRGAKRSGRETQARFPDARNPTGRQVKVLRAERRRGQGQRPHGRAGGVGSAGAHTALGPRLCAARLRAPLWLLGTNSGQSHDAGAARSASLPGAGGGRPGAEQPRGTFLGKVETPGGVQLLKAPPALGALRQLRLIQRARKLSKLRADLPPRARAQSDPGLAPRPFPFLSRCSKASSLKALFWLNQTRAEDDFAQLSVRT
ncbi:uncharacterized protein LOC127213582 [Phodopus roborovskii]|uniref:uncharacterized protein LOC127213582 n=1 Tax=Phodopus roborovskii TaxID=109678 RepID=UPI0021E44B0A|nr:uncharacterized protein LOC127213582 [Phodopus roborovskii]